MFRKRQLTKTSLLWASLLAICAGSSLQAQDIAGDWQGTLAQTSRELRILIRITSSDGKYSAAAYSIDQDGQPIPASTVVHDGSAVTIKLPSISCLYEGRLSAEGNMMTGTWAQTGTPTLPLSLVRATPETKWGVPGPGRPTRRMPPDADPAFEVATIKPSRPEEGLTFPTNESGILNTTATSLIDLIKIAFDVQPGQIKSAPAWAQTEKFDVTAKPDTKGMRNLLQLQTMLRKLLVARFHLAIHIEKKDLTAYVLGLAKGGPKLSEDDNDPGGLPDYSGGPRGLSFRNITMREFASFLQAFILDRPVVDQTGLGTARYDFVLKWTPDDQTSNEPDAPPDLFTAFQQEVGLKLESMKTQVDIVVIDHVERPSAN
jgi:uncharacterized protein (TIGR03435 family)